MAGFVVDVKEVMLVTPESPTPKHILKLSSLDSQLFLRFTIEYLFIYPPHPNQDRGTVVEQMKAGLARALVPYYPFSGRVRQRSDGLGLEVVCHAQGAVFIEAESNASVCEFERAPRRRNQWRKLLAIHVEDVLAGPALIVQLTWLADGAAALAVGISHCICDGIGSGEFLNSWAELATGQRGLDELQPEPVWDRHLLEPMQAPHNLIPHPEFERVQDQCRFSTRLTKEPLVPTAICFDRRHLVELKKLASASEDEWVDSVGIPSRVSDFPYTSFEVLSAHVWRCWVRAMELPERQTVRLLFSIDIRRRVEPGLPEGYYGNGFVLGCAQATVKELDENGLGWAAGLVRSAKERVGDEYVRSVVEMVSESRASPDLVGVLILSQWSRLGLERVDFGLGKPLHVGPICCDIYCLFLPVYKQRDAVKVMLAVPKSGISKYEYWLRNP
ncbi:alcohol acyltransferase 9 [Magnolia sinica]|uniref:alcohol acyltransferase 9 n=1 Tax=Magnolia sinica TaxID=86752 RepID=UPI0026591EE0|nr:alcohol acyltransferase 9 [Magnolia sinica]